MTSFQNTLKVLGVLLMSSLLFGCQEKHWAYRPTGQAAPTSEPIRVVVLTPFEDARPNKSLEVPMDIWGLIPLFPYSNSLIHYPEREWPDGTRADMDQVPAPNFLEAEIQSMINSAGNSEEKMRLQSNLDASRAARLKEVNTLRSTDALTGIIAASLVDELEASQIADEVVLAAASGREAPMGEIYIKGKLNLTEERRTTWTYGLSIAGPVLWPFFVPARTVGFRVSYTLQAMDRNMEPIYSRTYSTAINPLPEFLYYHIGGAYYCKYLPTILQTLNRRAVRDLANAMDFYDPAYWVASAQERKSIEGNQIQ